LYDLAVYSDVLQYTSNCSTMSYDMRNLKTCSYYWTHNPSWRSRWIVSVRKPISC